MKFLGIWPEERKFNKISSYVVLTSISVMAVIITIPQTINLFIIWGNLGLVVENLSLGNITVWIAIIKTIAFWSNGKTLKKLLSRMEDNCREARNEEEVRITMKTVELCRTLSTVCITSIILTLVIIGCLRVVLNHYIGRTLIVRIYAPYDPLKSPIYELTLASQLTAGFYITGNYTMVDFILSTFVFHTCSQLKILKSRLHTLHTKSKYSVHEKLADIVKKHNALYKFVDTIEDLFNYMLLMQMIGCTVLICMQLFQAIVLIDGQTFGVVLMQIIYFGVYISYIMVQLYLYCYIGEKLHSESMSMIEAAYESKWYDLSPNEARFIILIMARANTPLRLTAGKFCFLNHELFKTILKTSMSYLSVLCAMLSNDE